MPPRTVVISDTHLGRPLGAACSAAALRPLWQGAAALVINGDAAELLHPLYAAAARRELAALREACAADGVALMLIAGNHDPDIDDRRHLLLGGGNVLVTHGDALHPALTPWSPAAASLRRDFAATLAARCAGGEPTMDDVLEASRAAARRKWQRRFRGAVHPTLRAVMRMAPPSLDILARPWLVLEILDAWRGYAGLADAFARAHAPQAHFVLIGHTHRPSITALDGRTVVNTGCFGLPRRALAVVIDDASLAVHRITRRRGTYRPAPDPLRRWALAEASRRAA